MIVRSSYLQNRISYAGKMAYLYWTNTPVVNKARAVAIILAQLFLKYYGFSTWNTDGFVSCFIHIAEGSFASTGATGTTNMTHVHISWDELWGQIPTRNVTRSQNICVIIKIPGISDIT